MFIFLAESNAILFLRLSMGDEQLYEWSKENLTSAEASYLARRHPSQFASIIESWQDAQD